MDNEFLQTIVALLPFVILLLGFLVFKMNALRLSLYVWLLEIFAVVVFFHMPVQKTLTASVNVSPFFPYTSSNCLRSTGLIRMRNISVFADETIFSIYSASCLKSAYHNRFNLSILWPQTCHNSAIS